MESVEVSAKTEEEAIAIALAELGLSRSEVEVVVVKKGKAGIFGFGSEEVRVRVTPLGQKPEGEVGEDIAGMAKGVLQDILSLMNVPASVVLDKSDAGEAGNIPLDIKGEDLGILIGRRGETLSALQYVINLIVSRRLKSRVGVVVDVEGYRQRRYESLRLLARRLAEQVKSTGRSVTLEPMPPNERRIIHLELKDNPDVTTQSIGLGEERKIAILSKSGSKDKQA